MLSELDPQKVCFLIVKLREFGVQAEPNLGGGSDASDDKFVAVSRLPSTKRPMAINVSDRLSFEIGVQKTCNVALSRGRRSSPWSRISSRAMVSV